MYIKLLFDYRIYKNLLNLYFINKIFKLKKSNYFDGVDGFIVIVIPVIFIGVPIDFEPFLDGINVKLIIEDELVFEFELDADEEEEDEVDVALPVPAAAAPVSFPCLVLLFLTY